MSHKSVKQEVYIPAKTFLFGEYIALDGGPAVVFTSGPAFRVSKEAGEGFHPNSPAGRYLRDKESKGDIKFSNPYSFSGGLGGSTAEFLGSYLLMEEKSLPSSEVLEAYWKYCESDNKPSGYDLLAQLLGGFCLINKHQVAASLDWPFTDLALLVFRTQTKVATHDHLASVANLKLNTLQEIGEQAFLAWEAKKSKQFLAEVNAYGEELNRLQLVHPNTAKLLSVIKAMPKVKAAKGCGALGADTIVVFVDKLEEGDILGEIENLDLKFVASQKDVFPLRVN